MRDYVFTEALNPALTLIKSAQAFHFEAADGAFLGVSNGVPMRVRPVDSGICVTVPDDLNEDFLRRYFDLDRDYDAIARAYAKYPCAREAFDRLHGLRILRQPAWEALVAFLISQNNNTVRIGKLVHKLLASYGAPVEAFGRTLYAFPEPSAIAEAGEGALRAMGFGYRAGYLSATARAVADGFPLEALAFLPYEEAHKRLSTLSGVGPKVADCVLLFGCGHLSAYPVDVWVARLTRNWLGIEGRSAPALARKARAQFGDYAGVLQQYLFHCARCGLISQNFNTGTDAEIFST